MGERPPFRVPASRIERIEIYVSAFNMDRLKPGECVAVLSCGHCAITKNRFRVHCARCQRMWDSGFDWDGFINHGVRDTMEWPEDPLRILHEPETADFEISADADDAYGAGGQGPAKTQGGPQIVPS